VCILLKWDQYVLIINMETKLKEENYYSILDLEDKDNREYYIRKVTKNLTCVRARISWDFENIKKLNILNYK